MRERGLLNTPKLVFELARANVLQVDIDTTRSLAMWHSGLANLKASQHVEVIRSLLSPSPSKKRNHFHGRVWLRHDLPIMERIALQMALGDDPRRGLQNWGRARNGSPCPILLFESKHNENEKRN